MVLGSELGSISFGKAKKNLARKKRDRSPRDAPRTANPVADGHSFLKKIVGCVAVRHAVSQDQVYRTYFLLFMALPVEFSSLLITKK